MTGTRCLLDQGGVTVTSVGLDGEGGLSSPLATRGVASSGRACLDCHGGDWGAYMMQFPKYDDLTTMRRLMRASSGISVGWEPNLALIPI